MAMMTQTAELKQEHRPWWSVLSCSAATAVTVIWVSAALISVFAPDMVTGAQHDHLPIAAITVWIWAALATAYTLMSARQIPAAPGLIVGVSAVWLAVAIAAVASPAMVTGTDPTTIPIAAMVVPIVGAVTTGFISIHHATSAPNR